jgi:hypothetical protein
VDFFEIGPRVVGHTAGQDAQRPPVMDAPRQAAVSRLASRQRGRSSPGDVDTRPAGSRFQR